MRRPFSAAFIAAAIGTAPNTTAAGIPVIDVAAIAQLIQQLSYWQQQISAMANQLNQLQQTYAAMTGSRGMHLLLPDTPDQRNYLPRDYAQLVEVLDGRSSTYAGLSTQVQAALQASAVLSNAQLSTLSPETRQLVEQGRRSAAMVSVLSRTAYQNTSQRFEVLQQLIAMIGAAQDQKAIEDLQARINAEQAMLANEQSKLQALFQVAQADELTQRQRLREQVVSGHGGFATRFTPRSQ